MKRVLKGIFHITFVVLHDFYVEDLDVFLGLFLVHPCVLDLVDNIQPLNCPAKNCVLVIEPRLPRFSTCQIGVMM